MPKYCNKCELQKQKDIHYRVLHLNVRVQFDEKMEGELHKKTGHTRGKLNVRRLNLTNRRFIRMGKGEKTILSGEEASLATKGINT